MDQANAKAHDNWAARWPSDRVAKLKELWPVMSASQIGRAMGLSRMAIIGKVYRLGLALKKPDRLHVPKRGGQPRRQPVTYVPAPLPDPELPNAIPPSDFRYLMFDELGIADCHYPFGDRVPYLFCGQPCDATSRYCAYHHRLTFHRILPERRNLERCADWWGG